MRLNSKNMSADGVKCAHVSHYKLDFVVCYEVVEEDGVVHRYIVVYEFDENEHKVGYQFEDYRILNSSTILKSALHQHTTTSPTQPPPQPPPNTSTSDSNTTSDSNPNMTSTHTIQTHLIWARINTTNTKVSTLPVHAQLGEVNYCINSIVSGRVPVYPALTLLCFFYTLAEQGRHALKSSDHLGWCPDIPKLMGHTTLMVNIDLDTTITNIATSTTNSIATLRESMHVAFEPSTALGDEGFDVKRFTS